LEVLDDAIFGRPPSAEIETKEVEGPEEEAPKPPPPPEEAPDSTFKVTIRVDVGAPKPHVKALLGVKKLTEVGRVMGLSPDLDTLKRGFISGWGDEPWGGEIKVNLLSGVGEDDITRTLDGLSDILGYEIQKVNGKVDVRVDDEEESFISTAEETIPTAEETTPEEVETVQEKVVKEEGVVSIEGMLPSGEILAELPRSVRISTDLLESFINLVGELLITKLHIEEAGRGLGVPELDDAVNRLESLIRDLHARIITVRMMPLESILERLPRLVRDLAREKGKEVDFSVTGGDIELDRSILEELTDPLVHILRNAIDHGIEYPDERERLGKPRSGKITLNAYRERDLVFLEVADDGAGMDPSKVKESAISRGVIKKEQADLLSDNDLILLTFMPNLSTSKEVSDISGRGVGMDVVKTKVESLGGSVNLEAPKGVGTKVILVLPLTVAIIQALLVRAGGETFVLPLSKTIKSAEVEGTAVQRSQNQRVVLMDGEMIRLFSLADLLGLQGEREEKKIITLILMEVRGRSVGIEVDEIVGSQEVFIKSLGQPLEMIRGFSGATILGDGNPVLILDVVNLF
jgi:two-component system chemotaxis sensor kinase CheA